VNAVAGGALLASTGSHLENIGVILCEEGMLSEQMLSYGDYNKNDEATLSLIQKRADEVQEKMSKVVGKTEVMLDAEKEDIRTKETNMGDLVSDAMLWQAKQAVAGTEKIDAALSNGGGIRTSIKPGDITLGMVDSVLPYHNDLCVLKVTGEQLLEMLEASTCSVETALGGFPQVSGIKFTVNTKVPFAKGEKYPGSDYYAPKEPSSRVTITEVGGRAFSLDDTYTLASTSFICSGGDTYYAAGKAYAKGGYTTGYSDTDALTNYISDELGGVIGKDYAKTEGWFTIK
jgi:5'-nucleotidase